MPFINWSSILINAIKIKNTIFEALNTIIDTVANMPTPIVVLFGFIGVVIAFRAVLAVV